MHGVFLDLATLSRGDLVLRGLEAALDSCALHEISTAEQVLARVRDAQVILTNKCRIDAQVIAAAPRLKLVCLAATGHNNVELEAATAAGVTVTNIRDYCTDAVAQHVFALILSLNQHLTEYAGAVAGGQWQRSPHFSVMDWPFRDLAGQTLGIVGYGVLGRAVARLAEAFGMRVLLARRPGAKQDSVERLDLQDLLPQVDVLSLHCPLTPQTHHLIDADALARMKPQAILINTARGAVVDAQALARAIDIGAIGGAGIDVLTREPPGQGDPLLRIASPRLIVTPHMAWASVEARQRAVDAMVRNICEFRAGKASQAVNSL